MKAEDESWKWKVESGRITGRIYVQEECVLSTLFIPNISTRRVCNIVTISHFFLGGKNVAVITWKLLILWRKTHSENIMTINLRLCLAKRAKKEESDTAASYVLPAEPYFLIMPAWTQLDLKVIFTFSQGEQCNLNHNTMNDWSLCCPGHVANSCYSHYWSIAEQRRLVLLFLGNQNSIDSFHNRVKALTDETDETEELKPKLMDDIRSLNLVAG